MKRAIVTGHSKGLGAALADALIKRGYQVLGISRSTRDHGHGALQQVALDLSDNKAVIEWLNSGELQQFLSGAQQAVLINNAGMIAPIAPIGAQDNTAIAQAISLNLVAALQLSNSFVACTDPVADRRLVHISSGAARHSIHGWSIYCAGKAALDHHARCLADEQLPGLRVSSIAPGVVDTDMQGDIRNTTLEQFKLVENFRDMKEQGQLASPEETARTLLDHLLGDNCGNPVCADIREL